MEIRSRLGITGTIKIDTYNAGFVAAVMPLLNKRSYFRRYAVFAKEAASIDRAIDRLRAKFFIATAMECPNLIMGSPNYGLDLIIQQLVGMTTYPLALNYGEIGTGTTSPALTDTALTSPTNRAAVGFQQDYGTTDAVVQFFFSDSQLANTTYNEFGVFCGGTTTIGSGQLFEHALLSPAYVKTAGTDTTIQLDVNLANS